MPLAGNKPFPFSPTPWTFLVLTGVVGAVFRLSLLGTKSIWIDEAVSVALAKAPWGNFWGEVSSYEGNMVLYYALLRGWIRLGQSEFAIRSLSVLFGVAAIPATYFLGKQLFDRRTGMVGATLLAVHGAHIQFSQEARSYSLLVLLLILSTYFFARAVENPQNQLAWVCYVATNALAVYSHVLAVLPLVAQWLSLDARSLRRIGFRRIGRVCASLGALAAPMGAWVLLNDRGQLGWIPQPTFRLVAHALGFLTGGRLLPLFLVYVGLCIIPTIVPKQPGGRWHSAPFGNFPVRLLVLWLVFPLVFFLSFSFLYKPLFSYRYLGFSVPAIVLLAAYGLVSVQRIFQNSWMTPAALCILVGLSVAGSWIYFRDLNQQGNDWRSATRYLLNRFQDGDALFFYIPAGYRPFDYYANREAAWNGRRKPLPVIFPVAGSKSNYVPVTTADQIDQLTRDHRRVWLVLHQEDIGRHGGSFRSLLSQTLRCAEEHDFPGKRPNSIKVMLCFRRPNAKKQPAERAFYSEHASEQAWTTP
ncbi:MAG: glycosyltransferase family 39 protein [Acidobacteria bacterium]|nr:glycosyltransferase family 39 protein [Acidobacteriota bacterium]